MRRLPPLLLLAAIALAARPVAASHTFDFWERPGPYGNETVSILVMEALPSGPNGDISPRTVVLDFDVEVSGDWSGSLFEVHGNRDPLLQDPLASSLDQPTTYSFTRTFPLYFVPGCCTDILLTFAKVGAVTDGTWGLHNVSLDWSRPLPEPAPASSLALGLTALAIRARRRSRHRMKERAIPRSAPAGLVLS